MTTRKETSMHSYHQGDINFYPLESFGKSAADVSRTKLIRTTDKRLLIQEGEITGHHHGCWFMPRPVHLREDGAGHGGRRRARHRQPTLAAHRRRSRRPASR